MGREELPDLRGDHELLAGGDDFLQSFQPGSGGDRHGGELLERDVGEVGAGYVFTCHERAEPVQVLLQRLRYEDEGAPGAERAEYLLGGHVEGEAHVLEGACPGPHRGDGHLVLDEVGDRRVVEDDPLGAPVDPEV